MISVARFWLAALAVVVATATLLVGPPPASAAKKTYEDKKLGFRIKIDADWVQVPPKLGSFTSYLVGEWYEDSAKFDASLRPEFKVCWWATPKGAATTGGASPAAPGSDELPSADDIRKSMMDEMKADSIDEFAGPFLERNDYLFGKPQPMADRWKTADKAELGSKVKFTLEYFEVNAPGKKPPKGEKPPLAYAVVGRLRLDRPTETVDVGFLGSCEVNHAKKIAKEFIAIMRSFEDLRTGTDTLNLGAEAELASDPAKRREQVRKTKLIPGWACEDTENYILVYSKEVDPALVRKIGLQIESIRKQVYEVLFPADKPITAVCIVRVCKDAEQYAAYGGPGGSAGYWSPGEEELVFYEDQSKKDDSLRVLYHEAFHQYIHYSVGDFAPHSWFNEGHGDFFAGHNYVAGKWVCDKFSWRVGEAKSGKALKNRPPLREWLGWTQMQYYGGNDRKIGGGTNYALGWSFIYFLRQSKNPAYKQILPRYFDTLKGKVTAARTAREKWEKDRKDWEERLKADPTTAGDIPQMPEGIRDESAWLREALDKAFEGIDMEKLEKEWLDD